MAALLDVLTLEEKISQVSTYTPKTVPGVARVGLPPFSYHSEGLHGVRCAGDKTVHQIATLFPQTTDRHSGYSAGIGWWADYFGAGVDGSISTYGDNNGATSDWHTIRIVADERGRAVATVTAAAALSAEQASRLTELLSRRYGTKISLNTVIDPTVVGGLRVQIADDVIDMSVSSRLADLRQRLAG